MKGAIIGDIVGSIYEVHNIKTKEFPLFTKEKRNYFTDDTALTCATAEWLLTGQPARDVLQKWGLKYKNSTHPNSDIKFFGKGFRKWLEDPVNASNQSYGNGCVMRLSPIPNFIRDTKLAIEMALDFTKVTHDHPDSINAVKAYVETFHLLKKQVPIKDIKKQISEKYNYNLFDSIDDIRKNYNQFYVDCKNSVPQSIVCALDAKSYEDSLRNAISLGGDSDTLAAMSGGLAEARFDIPEEIEGKALKFLEPEMNDLINRFYKKVDTIA